LNVIVTPHPFWLRDKTMDILSHSRFSQMSASLTECLGEDVLTWCQEVSRAKTSVLQEKAQESEESEVDFGERWRGLSVKYDPATSGWKTHHCLFPEDLDWSCLTLPKWGMMSGGELWERTTQEADTNGIGAGCGETWPPPTANEDAAGTPDGKMQWMLTQAAKSGCATRAEYQSWATPTASAGGPEPDGKTGRKLATQVHSFPSPGTTGMSNGSGNCEKSNKLHEAGVITDDERKSMRAGNGGQLNPDWVEWLMGWPVAWTRLENTYTNWMNWEVDPADIDLVPRIATDIQNRIDRLRAIGNGQVPQAMVLAWNELTTNKENK
jgi:hypothetical protein